MNKLQQFIKSEDPQCGFLRDTDIAELVKLDRLCQVLVRCGGCRFTCSAQDVEHLEQCIKAGGDYIRDVSFPVGAFERAASWQPDCIVTPLSTLPASFINERPAKQPARSWSINRGTPYFNEADCGGAFDGNQVISDADSGL